MLQNICFVLSCTVICFDFVFSIKEIVRQLSNV